jgi:hypothetical protein
MVKQGMRREEAIDIVREIGSSCKLLNPSEINLEASNVIGHFTIHIRSFVDDENWRCLKAIAKKHDLGIKLTYGSLVIYKANEGNKTRLVEF